MTFTFKIIAVCFFAGLPARADINILIIGSDRAGDRQYGQVLDGGTGSPPFLIEGVATHLREILSGAGVGSVNIATKTVSLGGIDTSSSFAQTGLTYSSNLASWFYWPYGEWRATNQQGQFYSSVTGTEAGRWANLRGEAGTPWDYVVLVEDPSTIERMPGLYTLGVAKIAEEVAKGSAQTVLLMPWPAQGSNSTVNHYKEVVYRTGRSASIPVAPAGLAWLAAGSPVGASHPSSDGAFIAAATLYSRLFGQSAAASSYEYNDSLAASVHTTVLANQGAPQYSGRFEFAHPTRMLGDQRRHILHSNRGTSSENRFRRAFTEALAENKITNGYTVLTYNSRTPNDDGLGWPYSGNQLPIGLNWGRHHSFSGDGPTKSYFTNPDFWQAGFGFAYQSTSDSVRARGLMAARDFYVGYLMGEGTVMPGTPQTNDVERAAETATARLIPVHVLYAQIQREFPGNTFMSDQSHLSRAIDVAAANYMGTLYSGRTLVPDITAGDDLVPDPALKRHAQRVGYETAWMLGTLQARAPALKILPTSTSTSVAAEQFTVRFLNPPKADVTVHITVSDPALAEVSHQTLVFTPQNYSFPREISSRARNRSSVLSGSYNIQFTTTSDDEVYNGLNDEWAFNMPANAAPSINITSPSEGQNFAVGTALTVSANSTDPDGSVAHVTLWVNGTLVRQDQAAPYQWSPAQGDSLLAGLVDDVYALRIQTVDNQGASHTVTRTITVGTPAITPPAAPAGFTVSSAFGSVTLDWADNAEGDFLSYSIYRSTTRGVYGAPLATGLSSSNYIDTAVENETTYYYVLTAVDRFLNESARGEEKEATPGVSAGATLFGSGRDGYGGFTPSVMGSGENWSLQPTSVRYINDDADGPGGAEGGTQNGSLLKQYVIDRAGGATHRIQGVVRLTNGYAGDNNRVGIYLFGNTANPSRTTAETGDLHLILNLDTNTISITNGINGTTLASTAKLGTLQRAALFGTDMVFTAEVVFTGANINVTFSMTDQNFVITSVSTTVAASGFTGEFFGFATRARTRGTVGKTNPWTMDYKNFGITDTGVPAAPAGLSARADDGFVVIDWDDSSSTNVSSYRAYRGTASGQYAVMPLGSSLTTSRFIDRTVEDGLTYFYTVTAVNSSGLESARSVEASLSYFPNTDTNNNGIEDTWEMANFGRLLGENEILHESGVPYYFLYLHGTDLNNPADRFRVVVAPNAQGDFVFRWEMRDQFVLGTHYGIRISTNLSHWDPLPAEHYALQQAAEAGRTQVEHTLTLTHDYGNRVFIKLAQSNF